MDLLPCIKMSLSWWCVREIMTSDQGSPLMILMVSEDVSLQVVLCELEVVLQKESDVVISSSPRPLWR